MIVGITKEHIFIVGPFAQQETNILLVSTRELGVLIAVKNSLFPDFCLFDIELLVLQQGRVEV
jgi:hypothetical protein